MESASCAFTLALDTASTSRNERTQSSSCCAAEIRAHRRRTSRQRNVWLRNGAKRMADKKKVRAKLTTYDPAADLSSEESIAIFMAEAFKTNDVRYISHALGVVARAKGMAQIPNQTGLSREQLYRSFSENGNPTLKTTLA